MGIRKNKKKSDNYILRAMFRSAFWTSVVIDCSAVGSGLIDGIVISRMLGSQCMAAEGIAHPIYSISGIIHGMLMIGMQSLCTERLGRGDVEEANRIYSMTVIFAAAVSAVLSGILFFGADGVSMLLGARGTCAALLPYASAYIKGLSLGIVPMILSVVISSAVQLDGGAKLVRISVAVGAAVDIIFDLAAAYWGYGMFGMGFATSVSYVVNLGILLTHFLKKERMFRFTLKKLPWKEIPKLCWLGSERAGKTASSFGRTLILNIIVIHVGGTLGMSMMSIRNSLDRFILIPAGAVSGSVSLLNGIAYGQKDREEIRRIGRLAHRYILVYAACVWVIFGLFYRLIAGIYVDPGETELQELVYSAILWLGAGILFEELILGRSAYLQSVRRMKKAHLLTDARIVLQVAGVFLCSRIWGIYGVICGFAAADMLLSAVSFILNSAGSRALRIEKAMQLPKQFTINPKSCMRCSLYTIEEAVEASRQIQQFCKEQHVPERVDLRAALCVEELTVNIIQHGFAPGRQNAPINVLVMAEAGKISITIRDHCPRFDLGARIRLIEENKDPSANIGIKLVARTAADVRYVNLVQTNIVMITI